MAMYCDGSGTNGTYCGFSVVRDGEAAHTEIFEGLMTSNEMEYRGMIHALNACEDGETIYSDSMLVVKQLTKGWKIRAMHLRPLHDLATSLMKEKHADIRWVSRDHNIAGFAIESAMKMHAKKKEGEQ